MSTYVAIQTINLTSDASSVSFTGIPQTFNDLILVASIKCNTTDTNIKIQMNNDTSSSYSLTYIGGNGTSTESGRASNQTSMDTAYQKANVWGNIVYNFNNYTNTTNNKAVVSRSSNASSLTAAYVGLWRKTEAITSIKLISSTTNISSGSNFTLYGIGSGSPKAFGGNEVRTDGTYWYHTFRSSGQFIPTQALTADYLVIAGGGGGSSGGGGAGGYRTGTGMSLTANTSYIVTIGAGGTPNSGSGASTKGTDSIFNTITSSGGGRGGSSTGGSGGGADSGSGSTGNIGGYTPVEGFGGGNSGSNSGGGGGGAGGAGSNGGNNTGGSGGAGSNSLSTWATATNTGVNGFYAGGGGGSAGSTGALGGTGGSGGGGNGQGSPSAGGNNPINTAGQTNTGSGGGGGWANYGLSGGSGIVIVRYPV